MELTHGDVLELGMGLYSTPLLHTLCALQDRILVSIDNDSKWFKENQKWATGLHSVSLVKDWNEMLCDADSTHWSVVFIDEKPAKNRIKSIKKFANFANFIVIHDSEPESDRYFKYSWIYKLFKYRYDYTALRPHTTVLSNFIDVNSLLK